MTDNARRYEIVFCVFLAAIAYLYRENPDIVYPQVLWVLLVLLGYNLLQYNLLSRWGPRPGWVVLSVFVNGALISGLMSYSGGRDSNFWPVYLLPVFSSCLFLERRLILGSTIYVLVLQGAFYVRASPQAWMPFYVRSGVLAFCACMVARASMRERMSLKSLEIQRKDLDRLSFQHHLHEALNIRDEHMSSIGRSVAGILHDLNNPLTGILGFAQLALMGAPKDSLLRSDLEQVELLSKYCKTLVDNILYLTRDQEYQFQDVDVRGLFESALSQCQYLIQDKQMELVREFEPDLPPIAASPLHLQRVWINLLVNAVRASGEQGRITVGGRKVAGDEIELFVRDQGSGIPEALMRNLFEPDAFLKPNAPRRGLGLYICQDIVKCHGGSIQASNFEGGGACFRFILPVRTRPAAVPSVRFPSPKSASS